MSDSERLAALEARIEELEAGHKQDINDLNARLAALSTQVDILRETVLGDRVVGEVEEQPSVWTQLEDAKTALATTAGKIERLNSSGARGQPGAARVAKLRSALVRRATRQGTMTTAQAAQADAPALDYEDVLALFDYEIDETYATKLLDKAASAGDNGGFWIKPPSNPRDGRKTLRVDVTELDSDSPYLRSVRRDPVEGDSANEGFAELGNSEHSEGGR